jgi:hypothetical protein
MSVIHEICNSSFSTRQYAERTKVINNILYIEESLYERAIAAMQDYSQEIEIPHMMQIDQSVFGEGSKEARILKIF